MVPLEDDQLKTNLQRSHIIGSYKQKKSILYDPKQKK
jgi:hypothetical protein